MSEKYPSIKVSNKPVEETPVKDTPTTQELNWNLVQKKIETIEEHLKQFVGKIGFNPFLWIGKNLTPLKDKYLAGDKTRILYDCIMEIPDTPDCSIAGTEFKPGRSSTILDSKLQE